MGKMEKIISMGKGVFQEISKKGGCLKKKLVLRTYSLATLTSTWSLWFGNCHLAYQGSPAPCLPFSSQGLALDEVLPCQGMFSYCSKPHQPPRFVEPFLWSLTRLFWPLHGVRLLFPNHAIRRCHTFFISNFNIAHLCSKLGLGGQLVQIMVIHLRDVLQHLGTCVHRKVGSSDGETGGLNKLSPVAGTLHPGANDLSFWAFYPSPNSHFSQRWLWRKDANISGKGPPCLISSLLP